MCYSAMQTQAAKSKFGTLYFKSRMQLDMGEEMIYPLGKMAFGRRDASGNREALLGQFGLVPPWVDEAKGGPKFGRFCYNARSETIFEKASFSQAIMTQRAVIPVTAFFEFPDKEVPLKHRYRIFRRDGQAFWFAALWEHNPRYNLSSCSIITADPMLIVKEFHSRSPVILEDSQIAAWLDPALDAAAIAAFLRPHRSEDFSLDQEDWQAERQKKLAPLPLFEGN